MVAQYATTLQLKAVDTDRRIIEGYAAAIGNRDRQKEVIRPGAFDRTIKENPDVIAFIGHDASRLPVGEPIAMRADAHGLLTTTKIYETSDGDDLLAVAKARLASGKTLGMSIGFRVKDARDVKAADGQYERHLLDIDLIEYSYLASPNLAANPLATVLSAKRLDGAGHVELDDNGEPMGSLESLREQLRDDIVDRLGRPVSMVATFDDHAVVAAYGEKGEQFWSVPYSRAGSTLTLHDPQPVEVSFTPLEVKAATPPAPPFGAPAKPADKPGEKPTVQRRGAQFCVIGADGKNHGCYPSRAEALTHLNGGKAQPPIAHHSVQRRGGKFVCVGPDGKTIDTHDSRAEATAHISRLAKPGQKQALEAASMPSESAAWDAAYVNDLEDSAFGYVEPGGVKDDSGRTTSRALRHFPHHNADGSVNYSQLSHALDEAKSSVHGEHAIAHLKRHAECDPDADDAHSEDWGEKAVPALLGLMADELLDLKETTHQDNNHRRSLNLDTKQARTVQPQKMQQLVEFGQRYMQFLEALKQVEAGTADENELELLRAQLALLEV